MVDIIKKCNLKDLDAITDMAYRLNNIPESSSAFCFKGYDAIRDDFRQMLKSRDSFVIGCLDEEGLRGFCGFFIDRIKNTVDWAGPFVERGGFVSSALEIFNAARKKLSENTVHNFFFSETNKRYLEFMKEINAVYQCGEYGLELKRSHYKKSMCDASTAEMSLNNGDRLKIMKDVKFTDCLIPAGKASGPAKKVRKVFCTEQNGELAGYGSYWLWSMPDRATIESINVETGYRNLGYEEALLERIIENIYEDKKIEHIGMAIEMKDQRLVEICIQAGFKIVSVNCSYILK